MKLGIKRKRTDNKHLLKQSLLQAGLETDPKKIYNWLFRFCILLNLIVAVILMQKYFSYWKFAGVLYVPILILTAWLAIFIVIFLIFWLIFYLGLDFLSYKRAVTVEDVLPDFLIIASANIRGGIPIDKALWYAVRPRFGVLAREMELVAKQTMSGEDLETALLKFSDKYRSRLVKNTVVLIIEGLNAGGEMGSLLHSISKGIQENKLSKKEMSASVSAYSIFIMASALVIAPLMFALSGQLLSVITGITASIDLPSEQSTVTAFAPASIGITQQDFLIFSYINLCLTAFISAMIVATIKDGNIKAGLKNIPIFIAVSLLIFYGSLKVFGAVLGNIV